MKSTDVSFVVPAQLSSKTLERTLDSIINQRTQLRFEIIIIVDESYSPRVDRHQVTYIKAPLKGASAARNLGIKKSSGRTIAFVDGDTVLDPDWLEKLHTAMFAGSWCAAQGRIITVGSVPGSAFSQFREISTKVHNDCLTLAHYPFPVVNSAACLYLRDALQLFDESVMSAEDVELSWRVLHEDSRGFLFFSETSARCIYDPENFWGFLKRNFKVGRSLKHISSRYGLDFQDSFSKSMWASFQRECFLLPEAFTIPFLMRLLATTATRMGFKLAQNNSVPLEINIQDSHFVVNGKKSLPTERLIGCETLRRLDLKNFNSRYFKKFDMLIDSNGRKMVIGEIE